MYLMWFAHKWMDDLHTGSYGTTSSEKLFERSVLSGRNSFSWHVNKGHVQDIPDIARRCVDSTRLPYSQDYLQAGKIGTHRDLDGVHTVVLESFTIYRSAGLLPFCAKQDGLNSVYSHGRCKQMKSRILQYITVIRFIIYKKKTSEAF